MNKFKTILAGLVLSCSIITGCSCAGGKYLPSPQAEDSFYGEMFGVDANINMKTIDKYLDLKGVVYRDMRMLEDPIEYGDMKESNGDPDLSGYIKGFEVIPFPHIAPVEAPEGVGGTPYSGKTLFRIDSNGKYVANYEESVKILETIFPKDKIIFVMCGGGGYAGMTRNLLIELGWDEDKIYNIGGFWSYEGENAVSTVLKTNEDGSRVFDFSSVAYHEIDFSVLTEK
jgi:hypothetical protein